MRAFLLSNYFPTDPKTCVHGIFQRLDMLVEAAAIKCDELDMLFFVAPGIDVSPASVETYQIALRERWGGKINLFLVGHAVNPHFDSNWDRYGAGIFDVYRQENVSLMCGLEQVSAIQKCLARKPDWILAHRLNAMLSLMRAPGKLPPVILDLDDIEHRSHWRRVTNYPRWPGERLTLLHTPALRTAELRAIRTSSLTFVCSKPDQVFMAKNAGSSNVVTIPNSTKFLLEATGFVDSPNLLFVGTFDYRPNLQAVNYLVEKIWPLIKLRVPAARLLIAGSGEKLLKHFNSPPNGVEYLGFVDDLDQLYRTTRIVCCPMLAGGGTRIKIIEAAAHGKAIVSTTLGSEGLELENGTEISIHDGAANFAQSCIQLLQNAELCEKLGSAARRVVARKYDRDAVISKIVSHIHDVLEI